jgi:hypothetical protein
MRLRVLSVALVATAAVLAVAGSAMGQTAPTLDHFTCYAAKPFKSAAVGTNFKQKPTAVLLRDQVDTLLKTSGRYATVGALTTHCNPTKKTLPSGAVTPITNPDAHLDCWAITVNPQPAGTTPPTLIASVTNQFGTERLKVGAVQSLCVPSLKNENAPDFPNPPVPKNLDHFDCYAVTEMTNGFQVPFPLTLTDQFGTRTITAARPATLCMPVRKQVYPSATVPPLINPKAHLLCFAFPAQTFARNVFVGNQFGIGAVAVGNAKSLCVPSKKTLNVSSRGAKRAHHRAHLRHRRT